MVLEPGTRPSFCPKCGVGVGPEDRFCRGCGLDLAAIVARPGEPANRATPWTTPADADPVPAAGTDPAPESATIPAAAARASRVPLIAGLVIIAALVIGGAYLVTNGTIGGHTVAGTFTISGSATGLSPTISTLGSTCKGDGAYSDIGPGTPVTVKNENGELLDSGTLGSGTGDASSCEFTFSLKVPDTEKFYTFEVGRRGELSYSHDDMVGYGWSVAFSLGG